jgi:hypothetical protein
MLRRGRQVPGPYYDLAAFQVETAKRNTHIYKGRALNIIQLLRRCSPRQAAEFARSAVLSLTPGDYAHTLLMSDGQMQDVYGKLIDAEGWYLKIEIHIRDGQPGIVSCHPAEYDLETKTGIVPRSGRVD